MAGHPRPDLAGHDPLARPLTAVRRRNPVRIRRGPSKTETAGPSPERRQVGGMGFMAGSKAAAQPRSEPPRVSPMRPPRVELA